MGILDQLKLSGRVFTCLCQNPQCHEVLGGFHFPGLGGLVLFVCQKCGTVSGFTNSNYGIVPKIMRPPTPRRGAD